MCVPLAETPGLTRALKWTRTIQRRARDDISRYFSALVVQLDQITNSYPEHIRYRSLEQTPSGGVQTRPPHEIYLITRIQLDVLQCAFLLQRLLVSRGLSNGQELFNVAQEMISVVLSLWSDREQLRVYNFSFDWIVSHDIHCSITYADLD